MNKTELCQRLKKNGISVKQNRIKKSDLHKVLAADIWETEHKKMLDTNYWYKAWHEELQKVTKATAVLEDLTRTISIYLKGYEPLPENLDKREWLGYVLMVENSIKKVLDEGKKGEVVLAELKEKRSTKPV